MSLTPQPPQQQEQQQVALGILKPGTLSPPALLLPWTQTQQQQQQLDLAHMITLQGVLRRRRGKPGGHQSWHLGVVSQRHRPHHLVQCLGVCCMHGQPLAPSGHTLLVLLLLCHHPAIKRLPNCPDLL